MTKRDEKFREFAIKNIRISEEVCKRKGYYSKEEYSYRSVDMNCPCRKDNLMMEELKCDENGGYSETSLNGINSIFGWKLFTHIERQIRLNGCSEHIKILIDILGDDESIKILEYWSKKNILIGLALQKYISELKLRRIIL